MSNDPGLGQVYATLLEIKEGQGRISAKVDATHEYVESVSNKLDRHVDNRSLHEAGGIRLEVKHLAGLGGLMTALGAVGHWFTGLVRHQQP